MQNSFSIPSFSGIYKFTNIINNKIYIGSTKNLRKRFNQHINLLKLQKHHSIHFQNSYNKYGENNFIYEIIELCDEKDLLLREQYYLDTLLFAQDYMNNLNSKFLELSYNINPTTSSRLGTTQSKESIKKSKMNNPNRIEVYQFNFNGEFIKEYLSCGDAAIENNISKGAISKCCLDEQEYCGNFIYCSKEKYNNNINGIKDYIDSLKIVPFIKEIWNKGKNIKSHNKFDKKVLVFTLYGNFIGEFSSQNKAAEYIECTTANLTKNKNKSIVKNHYIFDNDFDYKKIIEDAKNIYLKYSINHFGTKFKMFDIFNNEISSWNSIRECETLTSLKYDGINSVLSGKRKQYLGYIFKYIDDIV